MIDDDLYELCRPVLEDKTLEEEDKTDKLEDILREQTKLSGTPLENVILDALWRHRETSKAGAAVRQPLVRRNSPAPWQIPRVSSPLGTHPASSPVPLSNYSGPRPSFSSRQKSSAPSPFSSPKPSPRLAFAQPIPHSPSLNAYEFSDPNPLAEEYGDYGSDTVDWLVADDAVSVASSTGTGSLSAAAPEWTPPQAEMGPYDILRSVLGDRKTNDEIEDALEANAYDIAATMAALSKEDEDMGQLKAQAAPFIPGIVVGKSMTPTQPRPTTPGSGQSSIVCKYWLSSGSCARADCRFAHDLSNHVCKYWMNGNCLAGSGCAFSHDPSLLVSALNVDDNSAVVGTPPPMQQPFRNDQENFPALGQRTSSYSSMISADGQIPVFVPASQRNRVASRPLSRPTSRHQQRPELSSTASSTRSPLRPDAPQTAPSVDDQEAFPTLGSLAAAKASKKHHGKRGGHGHGAHQTPPSSLADLVRLPPSPTPVAKKVETAKRIRSLAQENAAAQKIPEPKHIPWLETGARANEQYLKYRQEAIKHGSIRNKFLQSAAQAWNRNDARAAKALSLRGQAENDAMRKAHREAAKHLYEERNKHLSSSDPSSTEEIYIDLHGLHPEEAIEYLESVLIPQSRLSCRVVYAITGTGHHSKNGKDKVGKAVRAWLNEWQYIFREFSVPGERGGYVGGILGVDPGSCARVPLSSGSVGAGGKGSVDGSGGMSQDGGGGGPSARGTLMTSSSHSSLNSAAEQRVVNNAPVATVGGKIQVLKRESIPA